MDADPARISTWVTTDDVQGSVAALASDHVLVVADSCFSGALFRDANARALDPVPVTKTEVPAMTRRRSRWVVASGGEELVADKYLSTGMSVFAYFLKLTLESVEERYVTVEDIFPGVREMVHRHTEQLPVQGHSRATKGVRS